MITKKQREIEDKICYELEKETHIKDIYKRKKEGRKKFKDTLKRLKESNDINEIRILLRNALSQEIFQTDDKAVKLVMKTIDFLRQKGIEVSQISDSLRKDTSQSLEASNDNESIDPPPTNFSNRTFVPPDDLPGIIKGEEEYIPKTIIPREKYMLEVLRDLNIEVKLIKKWKGKNHPNMVRHESYSLWIIPKLNKMILLCEEEGNRTFIINNTESPEDYIDKTKSQLKKSPNVKHFIWDNPNHWKRTLKELLTNFDETSFGIGVSPDRKPTDKKIIEIIDKYREYYGNPANIKTDLEVFIEKLGVDIIKLRTHDMRDIQITCSNGESMPGIGYLIYAGIALGDAINFDEAFFIQALTLKKLKKIAEYKIEKYEPRDRKYYENPENIKKDLETYAFLGNGYGRTSFDEWIIYRTYADCTNGEVVRGHTWICNGAVALGYAKNYREAASNGARNLNRIEEIAKSIEVTN